MTVEVETPDEFKGEPCLSRDALMSGEALLLMHSNTLGDTLGKVRVLAVDGEAAERERNDALRTQALEELHQLGYSVSDGKLYPPEDAKTWNALTDAALRVRSLRPNNGGVAHAPRTEP